MDFLIQPPTLDYDSEISIKKLKDGVLEKRRLCLRDKKLKIEKSTDVWPYLAAQQMARLVPEIFCRGGERPVLCLSGGLDSQAMLMTFLASGVEFDTAVLKFKNNMNQHDIGHGLALLSEFNLRPQIVELNLEEFFLGEQHRQIAVESKTNSPQFAAHIWFAEQVQGVPVFAGEPWHRYHEKHEEPSALENTYYYIPTFKEYGASNYLKARGRACVTHFFELSLQWLDEVLNTPLRCRYRLDSEPEETYKAKYNFYRRLGIPVRLTSGMVKLNGFERLYARYAAEKNVKNFYLFNEDYRKPLGSIYPNPSQRYFEISGVESEFWSSLPTE